MCNHAHPSRRDFFTRFTQNVLVGSSILQLAAHRAAWAQALAPAASTDLFDIQKVADDVYFAAARPSPVVNCNAAIFVNSADVLVVDAHSKPSAAAALIAQIKRDVTPNPVRYLVDSHCPPLRSTRATSSKTRTTSYIWNFTGARTPPAMWWSSAHRSA